MRIFQSLLGATVSIAAVAAPPQIHDRFVDLKVIIESPALPAEEGFLFAAFSYLVTRVEDPKWNLLDYCGVRRFEDEEAIGCRMSNFDIGDLIRPEEGGKNYYAFGLLRQNDLQSPERWLCRSDGVSKSVFDLSHLDLDFSGWEPNPKGELIIRDCVALKAPQPEGTSR